jgi:hypothetical protein
MTDHGVAHRMHRRVAPRQRLRGVLDAAFPYVTKALFGLLDPVVLDRTRLRYVAETRGNCYEYGRAETFVLPPPRSPLDTEGTVDERVGRHRLPQPFVAELPDCKLVGAYPRALTDRNEVVEAVAVQRGVLALNLFGSFRSVATDPGQVRRHGRLGTVCPLYNYWSSGYFHWTVESLLRLEGVERYEAATGRQPTLLVGPDPPSWQLETLDLLGYGPDDRVEWQGGRATVDRLVVPTVRRTSVLSPGAIDWLGGRVRSRLDEDPDYPDPAALPDRVYVSRADADRRRVANEAALVDALAERGFERVVLSDLRVPEQAALFAGADAIVAPHGAGLTNLVYADDPVVVELFRAGDVRGQYYQLATLQDMAYHYRVADRVGGDLHVDVDDVTDLVDDVLAGRQQAAGR